MAAAAHVTINLYGIAFGEVPFQNGDGASAFSNVKVFPKSLASSIPTTGVTYHPLQNGYPVTNNTGTFYMYSVIEVFPTGLANTGHSTKYLTDEATSSLATDAG